MNWFTELVSGQWSQTYQHRVTGWIQDSPPPDPACYVTVRCADIALEFARERFADKLPVLQSIVTWPFGDNSVEVASTLGPQRFNGINDRDVGNITIHDVELTGSMPLGVQGISVRAALLAAPGESLLDGAAAFIGKVAGLTKLPQLAPAAGISKTIADGVDDILGNDRTKGVLAVEHTIDPSRVRNGYFVVTGATAAEVRVEDLIVLDSRLKVGTVDQHRAPDFDYMLLEFRVHGPQPGRWEELPLVKDPFFQALEELVDAGSDVEQVKVATSRARLAFLAAEKSPDMHSLDRRAASAAMAERWEEKVREWTEQAAKAGAPLDVQARVVPGLGGGKAAEFAAAVEELENTTKLMRSKVPA